MFADLETPCLLLDRSILQANLVEMAGRVAAKGQSSGRI